MTSLGHDKRSKFLDAIRGFAASYVMFHHASCTVYPLALPAGAELPISGDLDWALTCLFRAGGAAVGLFIAISGFSLMLPVVKAQTFHGAAFFYASRLWRIAPPYYAALLLSAILGLTLISARTGSHWDLFIPFTNLDILKHMLFIHNFDDSILKINGAYWSIAAEMQIYIMFPLYVLLYRKLAPTMALLLALLTGTVSWLMGAMHFPPNSSLHFLFAIGVGGAILAGSRTRLASLVCDRLPLHHMCVVGSITGFALLATGIADSYQIYLDFLIVMSFVGWMILDQRYDEPIDRVATVRLFSASLFSKIGVFAYSVYLIHEPVQQIIWQYAILPCVASKPAQFIILCIASAVIIIPVSFGFSHVFERPFASKKALLRLMAPNNSEAIAASKV